MGSLHLHDDENSDEDANCASPGDPAHVLELAETGEDHHNDGDEEGEPIGAHAVVGERIQRSGTPIYTRGSANDVCDDEQEADDFLEPRTTSNAGHVGNRVAACVPVSEVSQNHTRVCVQSDPSTNAESTWKSAKGKKGARDGQDTCRKDDCGPGQLE